MNEHIQQLREDYGKEQLDFSDVDKDPLEQFRIWLKQAMNAGLPEPNAMTLSTLGEHNRISSRVVLLKGVDEGFVFYTNYLSQKASELEKKPLAALNFLWLELERQVRIEGNIEKVSNEESEKYFASRPRNSQIGAWSSQQSRRVASREILQRRFEEISTKYEGMPIPRPTHWGGYRLKADRVEFWQGRPSRMHDRILFEKQADKWNISRLAP